MNSVQKIVFPEPGSPLTTTRLFFGMPPESIESSPGTPVFTLSRSGIKKPLTTNKRNAKTLYKTLAQRNPLPNPYTHLF
jgi:hypothetical protein